MRTVRENPPHPVLLEQFEVPPGQLLEQPLFSQPPRRVARAALLLSENAIVDSQMIEDFDHRLRDRPPFGIKGPRASDPIQKLDRLIGARDARFQRAGPGEALAGHSL